MSDATATLSRYLAIAGGHFSALTLERGRRLADEDRVSIGKLEKRANDAYVRAEVSDSPSAVFEVELWVGLDPMGQPISVDGACRCPVEEDCKHVVAVLLALEQTGDLERDRQSDAAELDAIATGLPPASGTTREWLGELEAQFTPATPADESSARVLYLLHPGDPPSLSIARSRPLKKGGQGKPVPYRPQPQDLMPERHPRSLVADVDLAPLRLFLALQSGASYFLRDSVDLAGEGGGLLLRLAMASGRLHLDGLVETRLRWGERKQCRWSWSPDGDGVQRLATDLPAGTLLIPTVPTFYVDPREGKFGELDTGLPAQLAQHLAGAPGLDEADAALARKRLEDLSSATGAVLPLPTVSEARSAGMPAARLKLTRSIVRHRMAGRLREALPVAELWFDYPDGISVPADPEAGPFFRCRLQGRWMTLRRDVDTESAKRRMVAEAGLENPALAGGIMIVDADGPEPLVPKRNDVLGWLEFLRDQIPKLERQGTAIQFAEDFPYTLAQADDWFIAVEESVGSDWFDLDLGVEVGTERISLVAPLMRLMREDGHLLETLRGMDDGESYPIAIDERRLLPVPVRRLKAWVLPLMEFLDEGRPRLTRHHAATLAGMEGIPAKWLGGEDLRALGRRLRDFSGLPRVPPAAGFATELRPYQQDGLDWLQFLREYGLAGVLADDMGLGKTVQTLAHLHVEHAAGRANLPSLVVATTSLMANWRNEAAQFTPRLKVLTLHGKDRSQLFRDIPDADLVLTTYPLLVRDRDTLLAQEWHLLVMDEAQFIKNPKAQSHQVARRLRARHRLSLTGTPLENHLGELWAHFDYLMPGFLGSAKRFTQVYRTPVEKLGDHDMRDRLGERVRPFLLRRTKEEVLDDLPPRTEMVRWVELEGGQRDLYESLRVAFDRKLRHALMEQGISRSQIMIFDALLKLRQICCDPRLVRLPAAEALVRKGHAHSAKLATLMEMLVELLDEGRKVLLFSQFTSMLALIEPELERRGIPFARLTGQTRDREAQINDFQEGRVPLFLISLKAGGTGLNLTAADTVIHYDPWWNPAVEEQATARAHRIGQDKPVFVYKLMTQGTVEERILALQDRKRGLADQLVKRDGAGSAGGNLLTASDLDVLFQPLG